MFDRIKLVSESAKKNKAQPNGLTLFDQTPGRNNFIVRKNRPTGQINNMTMRIILIRSGVKYDRRHVRTAFPTYIFVGHNEPPFGDGAWPNSFWCQNPQKNKAQPNGLTLFDRTPSQKEVPKPNGYLLQEKPSKAYKMTITL